MNAAVGECSVFFERNNEIAGNNPKKTKTKAPDKITAPILTFATAPFAKSKLFFTGTVINGTLKASSTYNNHNIIDLKQKAEPLSQSSN